ncbi:MAG: serine/threonine-protein kinase [Sandaracinaceae bacterium]
MTVCPTCLNELEPDTQFCPFDGTPVAHLSSPAPSDDPRLGMRVAGRYELLEVLGAGGMATVFRARALGLGEDVALKVLRDELTHSRTAVARFAREARAASRIDHPNVVRVLDFGFARDQRFYFLVMEHLDGESLEQRLGRGPLPMFGALHVLSQVASGMARAHELGVIHRDLKADNVMLVQHAGRSDHVKVVDFGLSRLSRSEEVGITRAGDILGTPTSMAPEQWRGRPIDERVDLYAFGVLAHHVVAGSPPFERERTVALMVAHVDEAPPPLSARRQGVPPALDDVVRRCLEKEPDARPASFGALLADLARAWTSISAPPPQLSYVGGPTLPGGPDTAPTALDDSVLHVERAAPLIRELERLRGVRRRRLTELAGVLWRGAPPPDITALTQAIEHSEARITARAEALALAEAELRAAEERLAHGEADLRLQLVDANLALGGFDDLGDFAYDDTAPAPRVEEAEHALAEHRRAERVELGACAERIRAAVATLARLEMELAPSYETLARHVQEASHGAPNVRPYLEAFGRVDGAIAALQQRLARVRLDAVE